MSVSKSILTLSAVSLFAASVAQGAIVAGTFTVDSAQLTRLYSGSFDPACTPNGGTPGTAGSSFFFCGNLPGTFVTIAPAAGGGGTIDLKYDDATGEVTEITSFDVFASDMTITLGAPFAGTSIGVVQGNGIGWPAGAPGAVADDFVRIRAGTAGVNGSADADVNTGSASSFQHQAPGNEADATEFAAFTNIVDSCVGSGCALIPALAISARRYELVGLVNGGAFNGAFRAETSNNSNYLMNFTSTVVPLPAAGWLLLTAVGGLAARQFKKRAA